MWLTRNKEVKRLLEVLCLLAVAGTAAVYLVSPAAAAITAALSLVQLIAVLIFAQWRYRQLDKLSVHLKRVSGGDYSLDLHDNDEGELSILKSEIYKVTVMLREQAEALKEDKLEMADALSDISHQLKTPLTAMLMMTDLLCDGDLSEQKRTEFTGKIRSQLERIQWLVTSLLKLSKMDAGAITFKKEQVLFRELTRKAAEPLLIQMELKQQAFTVRDPDYAEFRCDLNWTVEGVLNILKNCVEHTPPHGKISLTCHDNPLYTEIVIEDNGKGISKEDLPYIFKRFYKGKNAGDDSVGIGLAMTESIVTAQGGSLEVKSAEGQGTRFTIKFFK